MSMTVTILVNHNILDSKTLYVSPLHFKEKSFKISQSEVTQNEWNRYHILTHACGIWKNVTDEPIFKAYIEIQIERTNIWTPRWGMGGYDELRDWDWYYI